MIGTDIIEVARIERLIKEYGDKFLNKIYNQVEIDYCESKGPNKYQHYAGRFAAKEAVFKALSSMLSYYTLPPVELKFKNIVIWNTPKTNTPHLVVEYLPKSCFYRVTISISHVKEYATAAAYIHKGVPKDTAQGQYD